MLGRAGLKLIVIMGLLAVFVVISWDGIRGPSKAEGLSNDLEATKDDYLRAVHWFGDAWPVNFWNTDLESLAIAHLAMAKADGFNTVVFLVPWPGFAPDPRSGKLDPERLRRLQQLIEVADNQGFRVIVRLSYAWDWLDSSSGERLLKLWLDDEYYDGWLAYIESVWEAVGRSDALEFGFFSWEDLWAVTSLGEAEESVRIAAADSSGFAQWVLDEYGLQGAAELLGTEVSGVDEIAIPRRREPAWSTFMTFVSESWVDRFFLPAQQRFPKLSMEIRIDSDPIYDGDELVEWFDHRPNWDLPGADWVTLYWSPAMGGANRGEVLSAETGAQRLEWWLNEVSEYAGTRQIFIGQFLVEDFTLGYEMNGRIPKRDIPKFLELAQPVLQRKTGGFGLWTWADYAHDAIGNPEFFAGVDGWEASDEISALNQMVDMEKGDWIATSLGRFFYRLPDGTDTATLCVVAESQRPVTLAVFEDQSLEPSGVLSFDRGAEEQCIDHSLASRQLRLLAEGPLEVHRVNSTGFVQVSGMRDRNFSLKPVGRAWQALNDQLLDRPRLNRPRYTDGWMGRSMLEWFAVDEDAVELEISTYLPDDWPQAPILNVSIAGELVGEVPCNTSATHRLPLPQATAGLDLVGVRIEASSTHRPEGDARQLGCLIADVALKRPSNQQQVNQTPDL
jgi:hypothetical protein